MITDNIGIPKEDRYVTLQTLINRAKRAKKRALKRRAQADVEEEGGIYAADGLGDGKNREM